MKSSVEDSYLSEKSKEHKKTNISGMALPDIHIQGGMQVINTINLSSRDGSEVSPNNRNKVSGDNNNNI